MLLCDSCYLQSYKHACKMGVIKLSLFLPLSLLSAYRNSFKKGILLFIGGNQGKSMGSNTIIG